MEANIAINQIRKVATGVLVNCGRKEDVEKLKIAVATSTDNKLQGTEVNSISTEYNTVEDMAAEFKVRTFFNIKHAPGYKDAVVEVSPKLRRLLCDKPINIKWQRVQPRDYISIMQCYQCYDFGHKVAECKITQKCGSARVTMNLKSVLRIKCAASSVKEQTKKCAITRTK